MRTFGKIKFQDYYIITCLVDLEEAKKFPQNKVIIRNKRICLIKTKEDLENNKEYDLNELQDKLEEFSESERQFLSLGGLSK